jgi:hypothetical protein
LDDRSIGANRDVERWHHVDDFGVGFVVVAVVWVSPWFVVGAVDGVGLYVVDEVAGSDEKRVELGGRDVW